MIVKLFNKEPNQRILAQITETLRSDGIIIYPTDTHYAMACSLKSTKAFDKLKRIKSSKKEYLYTLVCSDLSMASEYVRIDNLAFRLLKDNLPGPFTFILKAGSKIPDRALQRRKTIGVRIPDNNIALAIIDSNNAPLLSTSVDTELLGNEYLINPELLEEQFGSTVDIVVDGGLAEEIGTTLVDFSEGEIEILREGKGILNY